MADGLSGGAGLRSATRVASAEATAAFGLLANDTRLAILLALWDEKTPERPGTDDAVSFSTLYERVGIEDSGNFTYHLEKLEGTFVRATEDGYTLSNTAERALRVVFAGTLTDDVTFTGEPSSFECHRCGSAVVVDYTEENEIVQRCTTCEGGYGWENYPSGMIAHADLPPAAFENRTPEEMHVEGHTWIRHRLLTTLAGVCPDCAGPIRTTTHVCDDHHADDGTVCDACGSRYEVRLLHVCAVCKFDWWLSLGLHVVGSMPVQVFFYDHGIDLHRALDERSVTTLYETITQQTVVDDDPLELLVELELDGDRLQVRLDDDGTVLTVSDDTAVSSRTTETT